METKTILLTVLAGLSLMAGSARAQIIASEDFNYAAGNLAGNSGGTGWAAAWANQAGTPTVVGGQANIDSTAGQEAVRTLSAAQAKSSGSTLWMRFAAQQFTTASGSTTTFGGFDLYNGNTEKLLIGKGWPSNYVWLVGVTTNLTASTNSTLTPSVVYARVQFNASGNDRVDLWLNPTDPANIVNSNVTASVTQTYADLSFDRIRLRGGISGSMIESWKFDNIAVGATLADVAVPPGPPQPQLTNNLINVKFNGDGTIQTMSVLRSNAWEDVSFRADSFDGPAWRISDSSGTRSDSLMQIYPTGNSVTNGYTNLVFSGSDAYNTNLQLALEYRLSRNQLVMVASVTNTGSKAWAPVRGGVF